MSNGDEKLVMAKELVDYFNKQGIFISYGYARALIAACPDSIRRRYVRPSTWMMRQKTPGPASRQSSRA